MHSFKDARGRAWNLEINCDVIAQVKEACGVNILDLADHESGLLKEVATFPPLLAKFLFSALQEQAAAMKIEERDFSRAMSGDALGEALDALLAELVLFFPKHRRELLQAVLEKNKEVEQAGLNLTLDRLKDPALQDQVVAAMDRKLRLQIEEALRELGPEDEASEIGSLVSVGPPPDSSDLPLPDLTPGEHFSGSPTEPGDHTPT
jgi:hypothetical protein